VQTNKTINEMFAEVLATEAKPEANSSTMSSQSSISTGHCTDPD